MIWDLRFEIWDLWLPLQRRSFPSFRWPLLGPRQAVLASSRGSRARVRGLSSSPRQALAVGILSASWMWCKGTKYFARYQTDTAMSCENMLTHMTRPYFYRPRHCDMWFCDIKHLPPTAAKITPYIYYKLYNIIILYNSYYPIRTIEPP